MHRDLILGGGILSGVCVLAGLICKSAMYERMDIVSFTSHTPIGAMLSWTTMAGLALIVVGLVLLARGGRRYG